MKQGQEYWTYYRNKKTGFVQILSAKWVGDLVDFRRQDEGRIFANKAAAEQASHQVLEIPQ